MRCAILAGLLAAVPAAAWSQEPDNVVTEAADAFGERAGNERIGLYSENQVRGFNLQSAGNYRINDAYFSRASIPTTPVVANSTVRVGINALGGDFPSPSGIVEYSLRQPGTKRFEVEGGMLDYGASYLFILRSGPVARGINLLAGVQGQPRSVSSDGVIGSGFQFGFIPEFRLSAKTTLTTLFTLGRLEKERGDVTFRAVGDVLPLAVDQPGRFTVDWGRGQIDGPIAAAILKTEIHAWSVQASAIYSGYTSSGDATVLAVDGRGVGRATGIYNPTSPTRSIAAEVKVSHPAPLGRIYAAARLRDTRLDIARAQTFDLGPIDLTRPPINWLRPEYQPRSHTEDQVRQRTGGVGYEARLSSRLQVRAGLQKTRYEKTVAGPGRPLVRSSASPVLYDGAIVYTASPQLTLYGTATRGLEEQGTAPVNAANRFEALPAALSRQYELGARWRPTAQITLISSLFQIEKPTPAFDAANVYRLIGEQRHRGLELSLNGTLAKGFSVLGGAVLLQPRVAGERVRLGLQSARAVGVASTLALASFNWDLPFLDGISVDGQYSYTGARLVTPNGLLEAPAYGTVALGARYRFKIGSNNALFRVFGSNLTGAEAWNVAPSGLLTRVGDRTVRATLSLTTG